ncbi:MAG TPA: glycosyltransferase family 39 protein [Phycisphaerae bacterium]|nr:glycosyltransferase family 39 protein [Phycisphaerae bacterium]
MFRPWQTVLVPIGLALAAAIAFLSGLGWGLPSKAADPFLFGRESPWSGRQVLDLAGDRPDDPARGADVDVDPLGPRDEPVCVNETDAQRAAIVRRYHLYTFQPDEMITMMALASMRPGDGRLDPKLYQYGGLWIYPVGAFIKLASMAGHLTLASDLEWYLDHPAEFGRFYVVARLYTVAWAFVGVWAVFAIARRLTGGCTASAAVAALCMIVMPIVVNMAHEAKPHLPAAVLMLLAILAAMRYVDTGRARWWAVTAVICGAAFGMVLSALPIFVLLPVMLIVRRVSWEVVFTKTVFGGLIGVFIYLLTNPYIPVNLLTNREVLRSNFGNSLAMYEVSRLGEGFANAAWLVAEGTSPILAVVGAGGALWLGIRSLIRRKQMDGTAGGAASRPLGWLLAAPVLVILLQFVALAAGKPGEYGRFAVLPDIALGIAAIVAVRSRIRSAAHGVVPMLLLIIMTGSASSEYLFGFTRDATHRNSRMQTAWQLQAYLDSGARTLGIVAEPAPYCLPPVDLFRWRILLLPPDADAETIRAIDVLVRPWGTRPFGPAEALASHRSDPPTLLELDTRPIGWADKRFDVQVRKRTRPP